MFKFLLVVLLVVIVVSVSSLPHRGKRDLINIEGFQPISVERLIDSLDLFNLNETLKGTGKLVE